MYRSARRAGGATPPAVRCFHCADIVPPGTHWSASFEGASRSFCCAGCLGVAQTIRGAGLDAWYRERAAPSAPLRDDSAAERRGAWAHDNDLARRAGLLRLRGDGSADVALLIEGITCGACVWLLEQWLMRQEGVHEAAVNLALRRAELHVDPRRVTLAPLLAAVAAIGYAAHPYDPARREALARSEARALLRRTVLAWLAMMQVMMLALPQYLDASGVSVAERRLLDWASLTLTLPVMLYCAAPLLRSAWRGLRLRQLGMDVPVAVALAGAFAASVAATLTGAGVAYYDSITMFVALLLTVRMLELRVRQRGAAALEVTARSLPQTAERYAGWPHDTALEAVAADVLVPGDVVLVRPGATIPADGRVLDGASHVDASWLTGESLPRACAKDDAALAGCINRDSALVIAVTRAGDATQMASLARLVEQAAGARAPLARLADRVAAHFVGAMLAVAAVTALYWLAVEPSRALAVSFAVLAVSCPCALSLATPATLTAAAGALARRRIVLTRPDALETLARVSTMAFDKTGTLTEGRLQVAHFHALRPIARETALAMAAALEAGSEHPLARALRNAAPAVPPAQAVVMTPGKGVEGQIAGMRWRIGRPRFAGVADDALPAMPACTIVALSDAQGPAALFGCADAVRADAAATVQALRAQGVAPLMLSGDRTVTVEGVAREVGIGDARGDLTPSDKQSAIAALQARGSVVAMVGDGVNDAPALAAADVAISLGSGTPLAQCTSDAVLLGGSLADIPVALALARRARRIVRENLAWALLYNALTIPAAACGLVTPLAASIGMSVSSLVVVGNALRAGRLRGSAGA